MAALMCIMVAAIRSSEIKADRSVELCMDSLKGRAPGRGRVAPSRELSSEASPDAFGGAKERRLGWALLGRDIGAGA